MTNCRVRFRALATIAIVSCGAMAGPWAGQVRAQTVRSQAVVNLSFDEPSGDALDSAAAGAVKDNGVFVNGAARLKSPFWGQKGKQAVVLDANAKQYIQIPNSADVSRPDAITFSLFFVNLHAPSEGAFRAVIAKRSDPKQTTNYGINYAPNGDLFQLYVNDATGYRGAQYGLNGPIGYRRPVFLTAVLQVGDAPAPDADEDKDDLLLRLYVNGKPVTPKGGINGTVTGNDVWLTDVKLDGFVNDVPLTLGCSMPGLEHASCVMDELSIFARALSNEEVAALFTEVAGSNVAELMAEENKPVPVAPEIRNLSLNGLTRGQATVLSISGANLTPDPVLLTSAPFDKVALRPGGTAERVDFEISVPATAPAGHYPLRVQTAHGVSGALSVAIDSLPQLAYAEGGPDKPVPLPIAVSGTLTGQQQAKVYFSGKSGQKVLIDLECRRLGAGMEPVLELRTPRGAPLVIAWGRPQYRGDTRIETTLFADGVYSVELHDLAYKAPGQNSFRMKIGELKIVDATFPPAVASGEQRAVAVIGPGMDPGATLPVDMQNQLPGIARPVVLPPESGAVGPAPAVVATEAVEILEEPQPSGNLQSVDAQFATRPHVPVVINGRIAQPGETDRYLLQVKPGRALSISAPGDSVRTPLEAQLVLYAHPQGTVLAASEERAAIDYAVPDGVTAIQVAIRDLNRRGGPDYLYRLRVIPTGQPEFSLSVASERIALPVGGSAALRVDVSRAGYSGPIALSLTGAPEISIVPAEIPADATKALIILTARPGEAGAAPSVKWLRLVGESAGLDPPLRRVALVPADSRLALVPTYRSELTASLSGPAAATLTLGSIPAAFFKGTESAVPVSLELKNPALAGLAVRLTLMTTEASRTKVDPTDPTQQRRLPIPLVRSVPEQALAPGETSDLLKILVPQEVVESNVDCIVRAEFVPHAFSDKVLATVYSSPFRIPVLNAVSVELAANSLALTGGAQTKFTGKVKRTAGFTGAVEISFLNLPAGYTAPKVALPPDQEQFEIAVTAPAATAAADLPNIALRFTGPDGSALLPDKPVPTKIAPGQ